jgi:hypothetical protein
MQTIFVLFLSFMISLPGSSCGKERMSDKTNRGKQAPSQARELPAADRRVPEGMWGGQHVRFRVLADAAEFEFDCAHGRLTGPLLLRNGRFVAEGMYVRERGRVRMDGAEQGQRVYFKGEVDGSRMILSFSFNADFSEAETFTLTHGVEARLFKCK